MAVPSASDAQTTTAAAAPASAQPRATPSPQASRNKIAPQRMGFDPVRPLRYGKAFVGGTMRETLNGIAKGGRWGLMAGAMAAVMIWMAPAVSLIGLASIGTALGGYGTFMVLPAAGALAGIGLGGIYGLITGGQKGVARSYRKEKYADEIAVRDSMRSRGPGRTVDYRALHAQSEQRANYNFERTLQQERENARDEASYGRG